MGKLQKGMCSFHTAFRIVQQRSKTWVSIGSALPGCFKMKDEEVHSEVTARLLDRPADAVQRLASRLGQRFKQQQQQLDKKHRP